MKFWYSRLTVMHQKILGYYGENLAAKFLVSKGYKILKQNYTIKGGEIDIIAAIGKILVFIEVKTRISNSFGAGEESVRFWKKQRLKRAIKHYLDRHCCFEPNYRVDLVEIELFEHGNLKKIEHFEDIEL